MKGKPIEPGCLAMIVRAVVVPENNGKVVRVIRRTTPGYLPPNAPHGVLPIGAEAKGWVVQTTTGARDLVCTAGWKKAGKVIHRWLDSERSYTERHLIRIDDDDTAPDEVTEETKQLEQTT